MHGRVKVRTSEEEKLRKEKLRQEKLKIFKSFMQTIQSKQKSNELDLELLEITGKVLSTNPDIYTLWNIRRDILILFSQNEELPEVLPQLYDEELSMTEYCLKVNPKSYCAWHQREWVLTTRQDPDWTAELDLCNKYLKFDERNFHTWDYRRFVVSQCKPNLEDEFKFTTEKLLDNFSNYSAWHYRSKMLVALYPDLEGGRPIDDSHHKHELKMVQSAAFTDPDDTSAWFYQRWLLGAVKKTIQLVSVVVSSPKITVAFNDFVSQDFVTSKVRLFINDTLLGGKWLSCTGNQHDVLWILKHNGVVINSGLNIKAHLTLENAKIQEIHCSEYKPSMYIGKGKIDFRKKYSQPVVEELNKQLESCRQLLTLEPDSKWTMLTTTVFLYCIDAKKYHTEVIQNLQALKTLDKLRAGYYDDLITKWNVEELLSSTNDQNGVNIKIDFPNKLAALPHLQYFSHCESIDLSNQNLTCKILPSLVVLQHCKKLSLANNKLTSLKGFPTLNLSELDLTKNEELSKEEIEQFRNMNKYTILYD